MNLFIIEGNVVRPSSEALLLSPFKEIWEEDISEKKSKAIKIFSYITFLCSWRKENPYIGYTEKEKEPKIREEVYDPEEEDMPMINEAIKAFTHHQSNGSFSLKYYEGARVAAEKVLEFFNDLDMTEKNDKGFLIHKPADITRAIKDTNSTLKELNELQTKVQEELFESSKTRTNKEINPFER